MTQKELLYYEDAIGHEANVISILEDSSTKVESSELKEFLESEINIHTNIKENLISLLEGVVNE
ncbi:MAG: hypothetical protein IJ068_00805 [Bacilli bacterium]|nr:hypothetical protein [Bacilli bacterium]